MKTILSMLLLAICSWCAYSNENSNLEYIISGFPDSIESTSILSFSLTIRNKCNKSIIIRKMPKPIEIYFRKESDSLFLEQQLDRTVEASCLNLAPSKELSQEIKFTATFEKDSTIKLIPNYNGCKTAQDSILAGIIGLSRIHSRKPLLRGTYQVAIYINITEMGAKQDYYRIIKTLRIQ
jgi:hypothetical protein